MQCTGEVDCTGYRKQTPSTARLYVHEFKTYREHTTILLNSCHTSVCTHVHQHLCHRCRIWQQFYATLIFIKVTQESSWINSLVAEIQCWAPILKQANHPRMIQWWVPTSGNEFLSISDWFSVGSALKLSLQNGKFVRPPYGPAQMPTGHGLYSITQMFTQEIKSHAFAF